MAEEGAAANNANKKEIFENCVPFSDCISETNNTQGGRFKAEDLDVVMPIYNLIEYCDNHSKTSLWQYYRDKPALTNYWCY